MRKLLGGVVLVAGVGGLGWYGSSFNAETMQAEITAAAKDASQGTVHPLSTSVSGRDISVSGIVNDAAEREQVLASLNDVNGRRKVVDDLHVLDHASPFTFNAEKSADTVAYDGMIPTEAARTTLAAQIGDAANGLDMKSGAPDSNWTDVTVKSLISLDALETGTVSVIDTDITITGEALTPDHDAQARAAVSDIPDGYTTTFDITVLDDGTPFTLDMARSAAGTTAAGKFPAGLAATDVIGDTPADDITMSILKDETGGFAPVAVRGAQALSQLEEGTMTLVEEHVTLSGTALSPLQADAAKAALSTLPDGYTADIDIALRDDGTPVSFDVTYSAIDGGAVTGKLPADTAPEDIAAALTLKAVSGAPVTSLIEEASDDTLAPLEAISGWLPELESMTYQNRDGVISVDAVAAHGVDHALLKAGLASELGDGVELTVSSPSSAPADGTTRTNYATERSEMFTSGHWLPVLNFTADLGTCDAQSQAALQTNSVRFVSGSAQLDAKSVRAINSVSAIVLKCVAETDLLVEIEGHTDSQGDEALNLDLSQQRAEAVRVALIARGVAQDAVTSIGYGETAPIADNETAEGRAANRRTAIIWSEPVAEIPVIETEAEVQPEPEADTVNTDTNTEVGE